MGQATIPLMAGDGGGASKGPAAAGGLAKRPEASIGTHAKLERKGWGSWTIEAKGLYAGAVIAALSLVGIMVWLEPLKNAQHFNLALIATFAAGLLVSAIVGGARLRDAMERGDEYRAELQRVSAEKSVLENRILQNRQSSVAPPRPQKGKK